MAQTVSHEGIVIKITDNAIVVRILQQEACGVCRAKELCGNGTEKDITIPIEYTEDYREGGRVQVEMSEELGLQATMIVYVFPFVIILTALMLLLNFGCGEVISGLVALGTGAVYFAVLSLFRKKLSRKIVFTAYPID
ncbi:MAG: SoxR reducing system RseC family protein [Rikenellaceae bacterium]|nr:SoxR reducing system RseC family protein [Rikenellaceae bacterium]